VYGLIRDVSRWPELFAACVGVSVEQSGESGELVRVDAMQAGQEVSWVTRRSYRDAIHRIDYELVVPMPFVAAMSGEWRVVPIDGHRCLLTVDRRWQMASDVTGVRSDVRTPAQAAAFVRAFIDSSATAEMQAISELVADAKSGLAASR
jgi:aromatase